MTERIVENETSDGQWGSRSGSIVARLVAACIAVALIAGACGSGTDLPGAVDKSNPTPTTQGAGSGDDAEVCADSANMFDLLNRATYSVVGATETSDGTRFTSIGTAWAVSDRVLVTNAHVTEAFRDIAAAGIEFTSVLGVQAGTGDTVELLRGLVHPDYTGNGLRSPDVGLFTSKEPLPAKLTLAPDDVDVQVGDDIMLVGFPGDVEEFISVVPGETVPQATSLSGQVTARRTYDDSREVTDDNFDFIQHQAPTTPGTSGSAVAICNSVVAVNNAGTVRLVEVPSDGGTSIERQAAASNNFAVHVKFVRQMVELFNANALQGFELPVQVTPPPVAAGPTRPEVLMVSSAVTAPQAAHEFQIAISDDGTISGTSEWPETGQFTLAGQLNEDGTLVFVDDAPERVSFRRGIYEGVLQDGVITGVYYEESREDTQFEWTATL